jgi:hypothetical protein
MELILSIVVALVLYEAVRRGTLVDLVHDTVRTGVKLLVGLMAAGAVVVIGFYTYINWTDWTNPYAMRKWRSTRTPTTKTSGNC